MRLSQILISFAVFAVIITPTLSTLTSYLPYQSHSFNDLDYVIQQLIRGVDDFKIDVNMMDEETCLKYSTWKEGDGECQTDVLNSVMCCLGFRGDTSSGPIVNDYFNTTDELLALISNPKYDFVWKKDTRLPQYNRTIYFAFNLQYDNIIGILTKRWLAGMVNVIQSRNLDIQLIFGGSKMAQDYHRALCFRKKQCDDDDLAIAKYFFIGQSDDTAGTIEWDPRNRNFNGEFPTIPKYCAAGFPAWADSLPYQFYEVSHEEDVQFSINAYQSSSCKKRPSHEDLYTIRLTSNIDPEMLDNYMPKLGYLFLTNATNILIDTFVQDESALFSYYDAASKYTYLELRSLQDGAFLFSIAATIITDGPLLDLSYHDSVLLTQNSSSYTLYTVTVGNELSLEAFFSTSAAGSLTADAVTVNGNTYFEEIAISSGNCAGLLVILTQVETKSTFTECITGYPFANSAISDGDLAIEYDESSNTLRGILFASASITYLGQQKPALYAFSIDFNLATQQFTTVVPKAFIDFGNETFAKLIKDASGQLFVLEAHTNGLNQNGAFFNNGNMYKCGLPSTTNPHRARMQSVKHLMNYNWGRLDDFVERISGGNYVTACDSEIMHAKFGNGDNPHALIFRNSTSGVLQALVVNQNVPYKDLPILTKLFGGATNPDGEVFNSVRVNLFGVLDYDIFGYI